MRNRWGREKEGVSEGRRRREREGGRERGKEGGREGRSEREKVSA